MPGPDTHRVYSILKNFFYISLMKKILSLLLAYLFLSVYVVNAQHAFEHTVENEAHHSCLQCLQISKVGNYNEPFTIELKQAEHQYTEAKNYYSFQFAKLILEGNVSKRGPPSLTS